jgi:integration host factor subunit beta
MGYEVFADLGRIYGWAAARRGTAMTKSQLVQRVAELHPYLHHSDVERVVETIFEKIGTALARRNRIEIRGFGIAV